MNDVLYTRHERMSHTGIFRHRNFLWRGAGGDTKTNKMGNGRDGVVEVKTCVGLEVVEGKFSCTFYFVCQSRSKSVCTA